ncbi:phosphoribosylformylglycinamidine synthase [Coprobacter tertius]|uniref:Phosphoribosylformylglycinamidine synthase n=1 Tax=Coprobacter tertius TaxID=2944915 RepID=A0ABT1MF47_9BACT|nr:phosphoribosylformylglycinamidine synthase [Coprobacter tertius]MCP9611255.1 phosphoribosylformylglycinamidine synthase [Coprobacter tertius]
MVLFFKTPDQTVIAVEADHSFSPEEKEKLCWLFSQAEVTDDKQLGGWFIGPRKEMITPWSTNAVEITQNMGLSGITRIEEYFAAKDKDAEHDPMLQRMYNGLNQQIFEINKKPDPIVYIDDIVSYNKQEGLALSDDEVNYLNELSKKIGRKLTDSEVFGFSQVNSEHCRHKIFNGVFIIDGEEKESSLFKLIKKTSEYNPNRLVSAYKDNVAFNEGPEVEQFAPASQDKPDYFEIKDIKTVISLKAETHNFPTTVEPFNGAATGTGGEIRDRLGGGKASLPIAGTAVYMTSYPRTEEGREWEENAMPERKWLYQTPEQILVKASNGASDFGNKFGQPLICGSLLTFEHAENYKKFAYDKVIMLAGGVGFGTMRDALKGTPEAGQKVVVMGGDNYRIGMGGGAVSSVETGVYANAIELNAIQRANPEMQKRASNVIRALAEADENPIVSIHDHGAGGHLNALSELVESTGGKIEMDKLPIGDPTLSAKEIVGNESQERMGMVIQEKDIEKVRQIADRERAPMYVVGETTGDMRFVFEQADGVRPIDLAMEDMFGKAPRTVMKDKTIIETYQGVKYVTSKIHEYLENVLQLEAVACKDWLTNKVDRSVTGKVARQQCQGEIQLPLSDCGVVALDYRGKAGIATSIGHAPQAAMADPEAGSVLAVAESLTNIIWAPLSEGLQSVSLSANWMWPCKNEGEDARLYKAVEACSRFACELGINIPTGKDSLSMTQKYGDEKVYSPGTVIISAGAEVSDVKKVISPVLVHDRNSAVYYIDFSFDSFKLGGSAFAQSLNKIGNEVPTVKDSEYFASAFETIQELINKGLILAGHDISAGGMITALLEMNFANVEGGLEINLDKIAEKDIIKILFSENPGILIQVKDKIQVEKILQDNGIGFLKIGRPCNERHLLVKKDEAEYQFGIDHLRDVWYSSSYLLDRKQSGEKSSKDRFENYKQQPIQIKFNSSFTGKLSSYGINPDRRQHNGIKAAIIREKGVNGDREMAYSLYLAGFDVKDVHMTDLISGRETLEDVNMIVYCGGFSNSDVLGSAKGWAGGFLWNEKAKVALDRFYARKDTLSLGICNGCQLMVELGLLTPDHEKKPKMRHNDSHKFESEFIGLTIPKNNSVMFGSLSGSKLGIWVAHGEGKFELPYDKDKYNVVAQYSYDAYPANPNGSPWAIAGIASEDGRHLALMPHLERAIFPWQWAYYPYDRKNEDQVTPWIEAFVNARKWVEKQNGK